MYICVSYEEEIVEVKPRNASMVRWIITLKRVDRLLAVIDEARVFKGRKKTGC